MNYFKKLRKNHALDSVDDSDLEHIIKVFKTDPVSVDDLLLAYPEEQCKIIRNTLFK